MSISASHFWEKFLKPLGCPTNCKKAVITVDVDSVVTVDLTLLVVLEKDQEKELIEEVKKYRLELCEPDS